MTLSMQRIMYILGHSYGLNGCRAPCVAFQGSPGGGKTTLIREFAEKYLGGRCSTLEVSRMQGTDLNIPIPDHVAKRVDFYPSGTIQDLAQGKDGMLFFDELTRPSDQGSLAACMNIFLDHVLADVDFKQCIVWAAFNPASQVGGVDLDPAFANRLVIIDWPEEDASAGVESFADHVNGIDAVTGKRSGRDWAEPPVGWESRWPAAYEKASQDICAFLRVQPNLLVEECPTTFRPWCSKRSWSQAINCLAACYLHHASQEEIKAILSGTVGGPPAHAFLTWRTMADLPNPRDVVMGKVDVAKRQQHDAFVILSAACDYFIAAWNKTASGGANSEDTAKAMEKAGLGVAPFRDAVINVGKNLSLEAICPLAGRLSKAKIACKEMVPLYELVMTTI